MTEIFWRCLHALSELIGTLCRGVILKQKPYNFTTNMQNACLSTPPPSLRAFMIRKTCPVAQNPCEGQLSQYFVIVYATEITLDI